MLANKPYGGLRAFTDIVDGNRTRKRPPFDFEQTAVGSRCSGFLAWWSGRNACRSHRSAASLSGWLLGRLPVTVERGSLNMNKLRLRLGSAELEYEGDQDFDKAEILEFLEHLSKTTHASKPQTESPVEKETRESDPLDLGVESIASKLGVKSGPQLLTASALFLEAVKKETSYSRRDLLEAAKSGSGFYTDNVRKNLSNYLQSLVRTDKLNKRGDNQYSLNAQTKKELLEKLG